MNTKAFVRQHKIRMDVEWTDKNPNMTDDDKWARSARHFRCTFKMSRRRMTAYFSQGYAIEREPTAADVLDCLASDACSYDNARSFEEFASDLGYDPDSRKALATYEACGRLSKQLQALLGDNALYQQLLFETERL